MKMNWRWVIVAFVWVFVPIASITTAQERDQQQLQQSPDEEVFISKEINRIQYPSLEPYRYYGAIYYNKLKQRFGYLIQRYNQQGKKVREEFSNGAGQLLLFSVFDYNSDGNLVKREVYDGSQTLMFQSNYDYGTNSSGASGKVQKKFLRRDDRNIYLYYNYANYPGSSRPLYEIESHYSEEFDDSESYNLINKKIYSYFANRVLIENFQKKSKNREFEFRSAEVYDYLSAKRLNRIFYLDRDRNIREYARYYYTEDRQIRRINVYKTLGDPIRWEGFIPEDDLSSQFDLDHSILYAYSSKPFQTLQEPSRVSFNKQNNVQQILQQPQAVPRRWFDY